MTSNGGIIIMLIFSIFLIGIALIVIGFYFYTIFNDAKERKLNLKQRISGILMIIGVVMVILSPIYVLIW